MFVTLEWLWLLNLASIEAMLSDWKDRKVYETALSCSVSENSCGCLSDSPCFVRWQHMTSEPVDGDAYLKTHRQNICGGWKGCVCVQDCSYLTSVCKLQHSINYSKPRYLFGSSMYCVTRGRRMYHDPFRILAYEQINKVPITNFIQSFARTIYVDA